MKEKEVFLIFKKYLNLVVAFSEKKDGSMKLSTSFEEVKIVGKNRKRFLTSLGIDLGNLVSAGLVHGDGVKIVTKEKGGGIIPNTDALITNEKGLFLSITVADCLPIFIFDPQKEVVALIHGGWRSLEKGIVEKTIEKMKNIFNSLPADILVGIGPGISSCHYEVGPEVAKVFHHYSGAIEKKREKIFLDLKRVAFLKLLKEKIKKENIEINRFCTYCEEEKFFSYRRDKSQPIKTMMAVIGQRL